MSQFKSYNVSCLSSGGRSVTRKVCARNPEDAVRCMFGGAVPRLADEDESLWETTCEEIPEEPEEPKTDDSE